MYQEGSLERRFEVHSCAIGRTLARRLLASSSSWLRRCSDYRGIRWRSPRTLCQSWCSRFSQCSRHRQCSDFSSRQEGLCLCRAMPQWPQLPCEDVHSEPSSLSPTPSEKSFRRETTGSTIASALSTSSFGLSESDRSMSPIESPTEGGQGFSVQGRVWQLCQQQTGCRRVQAALDECGSDQERKALAEELLGHVWEAARCPFGNYVLQRFITLLRPSDCQFIIKEISSHGGRAPTQLARHRYGCRILQRLLEQCRPEQMEPVTNSLLKEALQLVRHQYGNFVMQRILSHGTPAQQHLLCQVLEPHARDLTTDQNASAVLAKAMVHCRSEDKASLARRLLSQPGLLLASSKTRHGHQTALALIRALEGDELLEAVNMMKCNMASLMQCRYGRVVLLGKSLATVIVA